MRRVGENVNYDIIQFKRIVDNTKWKKEISS